MESVENLPCFGQVHESEQHETESPTAAYKAGALAPGDDDELFSAHTPDAELDPPPQRDSLVVTEITPADIA
jgi:hypothetical protein